MTPNNKYIVWLLAQTQSKYQCKRGVAGSNINAGGVTGLISDDLFKNILQLPYICLTS